jgi:hypothetical protein
MLLRSMLLYGLVYYSTYSIILTCSVFAYPIIYFVSSITPIAPITPLIGSPSYYSVSLLSSALFYSLPYSIPFYSSPAPTTRCRQLRKYSANASFPIAVSQYFHHRAATDPGQPR